MSPPAKSLRVGIVQCRGTPYEVGRAQARLFAATAKSRAFLRSKRVLPWWFNLRAEERMFARYAPALWEELAGIADELGITMEWAAFRFGNDGMRPPIGGCSAAITPDVYGRNYDNWPRYYSAQFVLLQASGTYASVGSSHQLTGRLDGMNEHGLMIGLHRVKKSPRFPGLSADLLVRMVLEQCPSTMEAVEKLRQLPHAMQYNYSLLDADGVAAVVEAGAGAVAARTGDWLACTNHFQSALLRPLNRPRLAAPSHHRLPPLEAWAAGGLSAEQMFTALNRSTSPAFFDSHFRGFGTLHTIVGQPARRRLLIGIGGDAAALEEDMLDIDFNRWLAGEDLPISELRSQPGGTARPKRPLRSRQRKAN